ncbi:MAG TPA: right-handed parallel beta-helix repeat-containing protein, partial [Candidatus Binatia bacterium]|nr:right-handed parallel beta-helix repeat-containing protein [Candidatus Binatia bacterium]
MFLIPWTCLVFGVAIAFLFAEGGAPAADITVNGVGELRSAVAAAKPGTRLLLGGGNYGAGFHLTNLRREERQPIVIAAADPQQPPVFRDGNVGLQFSNPAWLELHNLVFTKLAHNGINIDDVTGTTNASAHGIVLRGLRISDIGVDGNHDGIKLSGVWDFRVTNCTIERWGTRGGSAIDMVGCHRGVIEGNTIRHNNPGPPNCTGVQGKGGTSDVMIRRNLF